MERNARLRRRLKLRDLDTLVAVARHGSMAKAASELAVSQPAISKAIASMEQTLGVRLVDRTTQGVEPTVYGRAFLKWAVAFFDDLDQGMNEIEFLLKPGAGEVRIATGPQVIAGILPAVLASLRADYPEMTFKVSLAGDDRQQYRELRDRHVDVVIGRLSERTSSEHEIKAEVLFDDLSYVVAGVGNPLARRRKLELVELADASWTLPTYEGVMGTFVADLFRAHGARPPQVAVTCSSIEMHTALLCSGPFLSLYPQSVLRFSTARSLVKVLPIRLKLNPPPIGLLTWKNRTLSPVVELFVQQIRDAAHPLMQGAARTGPIYRAK